MPVTLTESELPKTRSGRKAAPLDDELVQALIGALKKTPVKNDRPAAYGPETDFDTEGKATAQGRKYANAVSDALDKTVRVNAYSVNGKENGPFRWRCYIPLAQSKPKNKSGNK